MRRDTLTNTDKHTCDKHSIVADVNTLNRGNTGVVRLHETDDESRVVQSKPKPRKGAKKTNAPVL